MASGTESNDDVPLDLDEDVVWDGSPLHEHLKQEGFLDAETPVTSKRPTSAKSTPSFKDRQVAQKSAASKISAKWPKELKIQEIEVEVAQKLLDSELLVQEDEDFVANFILTEEALELVKKTRSEREKAEGAEGPNYLGDALLISGSLAAAAATVLYLSERTRLAATMVSVLPTALAAMTTVGQWTSEKADLCERSSATKRSDEEKVQFEKLVEQMLTDMKMFKHLVRKSLNLLQGMELMHSGYMFAVNTRTGSPVTVEESQLKKALAERASFPALRKAAYNATVDLIKAYRESVETLMEVSPLEDHVDLKEHYIAFIELSNFGIEEEEDKKAEPVSVKALKDVVQLGLVQQSEYLRRFALSFSEKVRDDNKLNKAGLLKQVTDLIGTLQNINTKLGKVFEYHQAMGMIPEKKQNSLVFKKHQSIDLIPLRSVYTSLFSTGLHLQNSLLKVRHMEKAFDHIERMKTKDTDMLASLIPSDEHLIEWLKGFEAIQAELNACVGCLDEGVNCIDVLKDPEGLEEKETEEKKSPEEVKEQVKSPVVEINEDTPNENIDEVFEAVIEREAANNDAKAEDDSLTDAERKRQQRQKKQSEKVLTELRTVLVEKAAEMERREAEALARQQQEQPNQNGAISKEARPEQPEQKQCGAISKVRNGLKPVVVNGSNKPKKKPANGEVRNIINCHQNGGESEESDRELEEVLVEEVKMVKPRPKEEERVEEEQVRKDNEAFLFSNPYQDLNNQFEDSFEDVLKSKTLLPVPDSAKSPLLSPESSSESSSNTSTTTSSDQATVKSMSSGSLVPKLDKDSGVPRSVSGQFLLAEEEGSSSSSYEEDDEDSSVENSPKKTVSLLKTAPSSDSIHSSNLRDGASLKTNDKTLSMSELRSISSPDIKRLLSTEEASSPYVSLEKLNKLNKSPLSESSEEASDSSDTAGSSADEANHKTLRTFRRPLRPAAVKKSPTKEERKKRTKRDRNRTIVVRNGDVSLNNSKETVKASGETLKSSEDTLKSSEDKKAPPSVHPKRHSVVSMKKDQKDSSPKPHPSVYLKRHNTEGGLFMPKGKPLGFDAAIALQAAKKAMAGGFNGLKMAGKQAEEEVFGSGGDSES